MPRFLLVHKFVLKVDEIQTLTSLQKRLVVREDIEAIKIRISKLPEGQMERIVVMFEMKVNAKEFYVGFIQIHLQNNRKK